MITNSRKRFRVALPPLKVTPRPDDLMRQTQTAHWRKEVDRCTASMEYYIDTYVIIDDAQPENAEASTGTMPFEMWNAQRDLLADIAGERLLLILKARQLGISWLICAYVTWLCLFHRGQLVLLFSIGQDEAAELLRRIRVIYDRLPDGLRAALPTNTIRNTTNLGWANESRIRSLPTSPNKGSSFTASLVVMDEFAKNPHDKALYTAVKPTIDGGGKLIILSTAKGVDNTFYDRCEAAIEGKGKFKFAFLPWHVRPDRDDAWYARVAADAVDSKHMMQEYPATPQEAFSATGSDPFLPTMTWWDDCRDPGLPPLDSKTPLVLACDAGETDDIFGVIAVSRHPNDRDAVAVRHVMAWKPPKNGAIDFNQVQAEIDRFCREHTILQICYDRYQLRQMMQTLGQRYWCQEFSQQTDRLVADKFLLDCIRDRRLYHDGHSELRAHIQNADRRVETQERLRIVKRKHEMKIDLAVALSMATYRMLTKFQV